MTYRLSFLPKYYVLLGFTSIISLILLLPLIVGNSTAPLGFHLSIWIVVISFILIQFIFNLSSLKIDNGVLYIYCLKNYDLKTNTFKVQSRRNDRPSRKLDPVIKVDCKNIKTVNRILNKQTAKNIHKSDSVECNLAFSPKNILEIEFKKPIESAGGIGGTITPILPPLKKVFISVSGSEEFLKDLKKNM